ncbi:hypothetical protein RFI_15801, partial [Reticulomyxa filosa]
MISNDIKCNACRYKERSDGRVYAASPQPNPDTGSSSPLDIVDILGMIDNTPLVSGFKETFILRVGLEANRDYVAVPPAVWNTLIQWYGGGPALTANIVAIFESNEPQATPQNISYLELYPLKIHVHTKANPAVLDHARSRIEQMKMEEDFKAFSDQNEKAKQKEEIEMEQKNEKQDEEDEEDEEEEEKKQPENKTSNEDEKKLQDEGKLLLTRNMSWFESQQQNKEKVTNIDNGIYYQWDLLLSPHTSVAYVTELLVRYDSTLRNAVACNAPLQNQHIRLWDLKGHKEL